MCRRGVEVYKRKFVYSFAVSAVVVVFAAVKNTCIYRNSVGGPQRIIKYLF